MADMTIPDIPVPAIPTVTADDSIGTPSQQSIDGTLNGAKKTIENCIAAFAKIAEKAIEISNLSTYLVGNLTDYNGEKNAELAVEYKEKLTHAVSETKSYVETVSGDMGNWKQSLIDKHSEYSIESQLPSDAIVREKAVPLIPFAKNTASITSDNALIVLRLVVEFIMAPYLKYERLANWWTVGGGASNKNKILNYLKTCEGGVDVAILAMKKIKEELDKLAVLEIPI